MSEPNGPNLLRRRTRMLARLSNSASVVLMKLRSLPLPMRGLMLIAAAVLIGLLVGCATPLTPPSVGPSNPTMPPPSTAQPSEPYLSRVQRNIELWEKTLRDTLGTP